MTRTILLADDSVTIQKVVELTFLDEDVKVVSVGNGSDALAKFEDVRPDVVLADVHMPGADGYEVCDAARRVLPGVPVLLLVGTFELFDPERAAAAGASGHLKKPFDSQELLRRVRELMEQGAAPAVAAPALSAVEPPPWDAAPVETGGESAPGEDWSFEPVSDTEEAPEAAPTASAPAELLGVPAGGAEEGESWSFATSRFTREALAVTPPPGSEGAEPHRAFENEFEPVSESGLEPEAEPESYSLAPAPPAAAAFEASSPEPVQEAPAPRPAESSGAPVALSDADVERIARRVAELMAERAVRDVAWEVVPDLAEVLLKARIRELEASVE
jgi:CheY-like chemotaxis protein